MYMQFAKQWQIKKIFFYFKSSVDVKNMILMTFVDSIKMGSDLQTDMEIKI